MRGEGRTLKSRVKTAASIKKHEKGRSATFSSDAERGLRKVNNGGR